MFGKKAVRLATAALMVATVMGAQHVSGATRSAASSGVVAITDWQFPDGCNLIEAASVADQEICGPMEDTLFLIDNHLNYQPDLAVNIPTTKNGEVKTVNGNLVVTYKLKPNLKWSDGSPITADDLTFNVNLEMATGATFGVDQIKSMKSLDARTWQVTYNGIYAPYYEYGTPSDGFYSQKYLEKKYGTTNITTIAQKFTTDAYDSPSDVFSGAFKIQSWTNGQSIVTVPNPYYTALSPSKGHPMLAQLKFVNISGDEAGLATALGSASAGVDKAEDFQLNDLPSLYSSKYQIGVQPALSFEHLELNQAGPLKDIRLRQALQYAIDKRALFKNLFPAAKNPDSLLLHTVLPNTSPWANKSIPLSQYNPAKARQLIQQAGYTTDYNSSTGRRLTLRFATTTLGIRQKDFQILNKYWAQVGVHVIPEFVAAYGNHGLFDTYANNGILLHRAFDIALFAFTESPDPQQSEGNFDPSLIPTADPSHHSGGDQNYIGITDKDQFNLLVKARHALDNAQRHALFNQWQALVAQRVYWIPLYNRPNITATNGKIGKFAPNPSQQGNEWNAYQWYRVS